MKRSTESAHVHRFIPDYVLGLLPVDEKQFVSAHLSGCGQCRQALAAEQDIGRSVKSVLSRAAAPDRSRLRQLMPATPVSARTRSRGWLFSPGLAAGAIVLLLVFGTFALFAVQQPGAWGISSPTANTTSVVLTDTPTQTATREITVTAEGLEAYFSPSQSSPTTGSDRAGLPLPAVAPVPVAPVLQ